MGKHRSESEIILAGTNGGNGTDDGCQAKVANQTFNLECVKFFVDFYIGHVGGLTVMAKVLTTSL